jgi:hypothetical protein
MSALNTPVPFARVDGKRGLFWLKHASSMFRAAPLPWLLLLLTYYVLIALTEFGPWQLVGRFVAPVLKPVFAVGFLAAAWTQERGGRPSFTHLFRGFQSNLAALVPLGLLFLGGMATAVLATTLVDGGHLLSLLGSPGGVTDESLSSGRPQLAMLFGAACALPTLLALWFAPALVVFEDAGFIKAIGTSLRASLANWRAIAVYGLAVFAFGGVLPGMVLSIGQLFGDTVSGMLTLFLVVPYLFSFVATLHISDYVSYRDVFHAGEAQVATQA